MLETALVSGLFFLTLLPIYDLSRAAYALVSLQHATRSAARVATTGSVMAGLSRVQSVRAMVQQAGVPAIGVADVTVTAKTLAGVATSGAGGPGELITVSATADVPLITPGLSAFFPGGIYRARATSTLVNEEFSMAEAGA